MLKQTLQLVYAWIINVLYETLKAGHDSGRILGSSAGFLNETSGFLASSLKTTDRTREEEEKKSTHLIHSSWVQMKTKTFGTTTLQEHPHS